MRLFDLFKKRTASKQDEISDSRDAKSQASVKDLIEKYAEKTAEDKKLWEEARKHCSPERLANLKEREYQFLQCIQRGGAEPRMAAAMYGFVLIEGKYIDRELYEQYMFLRSTTGDTSPNSPVIAMPKQDKTQDSKDIKAHILNPEMAERELQRSTHLFTHESRSDVENGWINYTTAEYFLSPDKKVILKDKSGVLDVHSAQNSHSHLFYFYIPFTVLNEFIDKYDTPEANKYRGISEENCEQYL